MNKFVFPYRRSRDGELAKAVNSIINSVKGNASFPDATLVQAVEKSLAEYQAALNAAADGGRTLTAIKKDKRKVLINDLFKLYCYVSQVSNGDKAILLSSGFALGKDSTATKMLSAIEMIQVTNQQPGEVQMLVNRVAGARAYIHQYSVDPPSSPEVVWVGETTAHRKHTIKGLKPLTTYWFRVIAIGLNGQQTVSDPVSRIII